MKMLFVAFSGRNNSSKIVLDKVECEDKLYLMNDKAKSCNQITEVLAKKSFDRIVIMGQKPLIKNKVCVELNAYLGENVVETHFDLVNLFRLLTEFEVDYRVSKRPGNSYCNHVYFHTLDLITKLKTNAQVIFIHVPFNKNFANREKFVNCLNSLGDCES